MSVSCAMYAMDILHRSPRQQGNRATTTKEVRNEVAICNVGLPIGALPARIDNDVSTTAGARLAQRTRVNRCGVAELRATTITRTAGVLPYGRPAGNGDPPSRRDS